MADSARWCAHCEAYGDHHTDRQPCPECGGTGTWDDYDPWYHPSDMADCPTCDGTGFAPQAAVTTSHSEEQA